jgi:hypothetical protein
MNRIILIGNGFDLAHGMPTSYQDFLNDFFKNIIAEIKADCIPIGQSFKKEGLINIAEVPVHWTDPATLLSFKEDCSTPDDNLIFENAFLEQIFKKSYIQNWVDIENEYYELLKKSLDNSSGYKVEDLNSDFEGVKQLLNEYLKRCERDSTGNFIDGILYKAYSEIRIKEMSRVAVNNLVENIYQEYLFYEAYPSDDPDSKRKYAVVVNEITHEHTKKIDRLAVRQYVNSYKKYFFEEKPDKTLFLNFNYTYTEKLYARLSSIDKSRYDIKQSVDIGTIHIHGSLNDDDKNPIIFGYGDELDDDYKRIEKLNKNEYLENIKSIKYSDTDNYKRLLEFVEQDEYQISVFGHSCGTSDRTLLNTLFEHDNCASIKPFYHKKEDGSDNYSDIVRNISRNFNSKVKMRDRVVNKTYCEPLVDLKK